MTRTQIDRRWRRRLRADERGFTIVETVAALGIMFMLLVSLAYVVSSGLTYQRSARVRQTANALANELMEKIRGLPYEAIQEGLHADDLGGDANIVSCVEGTETVSRLFACTAGTGAIPGTAEEIVSSPGLADIDPLVPHLSSTTPNVDPTIDGVTFEWATYVTQGADSAGGDPAAYRVTVEVSWTGVAGDQQLRIQSLFWSPDGCRSTTTHPYAAPCQAFFYGKASVPTGTITIEPTSSSIGLYATDFDRGELSLGGANASIQQEQVVQGLADFSVAHADVTTSGVTTTHGAVAGNASADSDPNTSSGAYQRSRCGTEVTCAAATASSPSAAAADRVTFTVPTTTTAESAASFQAATGNPCPPSNVATAENDAVACAGASYVQPGEISAVGTLGSTSPTLGSFDLARVSVPSTTSPAPIRAFSHRVVNPTTAVCAPAAETDGCSTLSAVRSYGTIAIGGLPSGFGTPSGWLGSYVRITGYADSASASVGNGSPFPTTSASAPSGNLLVYNGTGYDTLPLSTTDFTAVGSLRTRGITAVISGTNVTATFTLDNTKAANASVVTTSEPSGAGTIERTEALAQVTAPVVVIRYQLSIQGVGTVMDLTTTVNLGTLDLDALYAPQPAEGS